MPTFDARPDKIPPRSPRAQILRYGLFGLAAIVIFGGLIALYQWQSMYRGMPSLPPTAELWDAQREPAIEFRDKNGKILAIRGPRYGRAVTVEKLPAHVPHAFIAAEDKRFYEHDGADETAIARAAWSNWRTGRTVSGASTITQQLIKNLVLDPRQTMRRKVQERKLAQQLETRMSKNEILSLYLNRVYYGAGLYGIGAASEFYFGKPASELSIAEASLLAGLPKAPSKLNLRSNLKGAQERQVYVLSEMVDLGFITAAQAAEARDAKFEIIQPPEYNEQIGYVLDTVTERLNMMLPRIPGDLIVTLTIDQDIQHAVHSELIEKFATISDEKKASQLGAVIFDKTGATIALVGGVDYTESEFNRATQAKRQPGSSFKAFVYAAALEKGLSPYDVRMDAPLSIGDWHPENYGGGFVGPMTLSEALARSTNTVAAEITQEISEQSVIEVARALGIVSNLKAVPSIALGSQEVSVWEMARAFGTFQSGGKRLDPFMITRIENSRGDILYERPEYEKHQVLDPQIALKMNAMLTRVVQGDDGTGELAKMKDWTVAGKTGTSQEWRDAWFAGYTSKYVGAIWVGNDDDTPMEKVTGGGVPADLWSDMMEIVHAGQTPQQLDGSQMTLRISSEAEDRIAFYRDMSQAFHAVATR